MRNRTNSSAITAPAFLPLKNATDESIVGTLQMKRTVHFPKVGSESLWKIPQFVCLKTNTSLLSCFCCWWRHYLLSIIVYFPLSFFVVSCYWRQLVPYIYLTLPLIFLPFVTLHLTLPYLISYLSLPYLVPYLTFCLTFPYLTLHFAFRYLTLPYVLPYLTLPYFLLYLTISLTLHFALPYLTS